MKRFLKYDTDDAKNGLININRYGIIYPEIFTVKFHIDSNKNIFIDTSEDSLNKAYEDNKIIKAMLTMQNGKFVILDIHPYYEQGIKFCTYFIAPTYTTDNNNVLVSIHITKYSDEWAWEQNVYSLTSAKNE